MNFKEFYELGLGLNEAPNEKELFNKNGEFVVFFEFSHILSFKRIKNIFKKNENMFSFIEKSSIPFSEKEEIDYRVYFFFLGEGVSNLYLYLKLENLIQQPLLYINEDNGLFKNGFFGCFITNEEKNFKVKAYGFNEKQKILGAEVEIVFTQTN